MTAHQRKNVPRQSDAWVGQYVTLAGVVALVVGVLWFAYAISLGMKGIAIPGNDLDRMVITPAFFWGPIVAWPAILLALSGGKLAAAGWFGT